jgi:hypothetical protein
MSQIATSRRSDESRMTASALQISGRTHTSDGLWPGKTWDHRCSAHSEITQWWFYVYHIPKNTTKTLFFHCYSREQSTGQTVVTTTIYSHMTSHTPKFGDDVITPCDIQEQISTSRFSRSTFVFIWCTQFWDRDIGSSVEVWHVFLLWKLTLQSQLSCNILQMSIW